MFLTHKIHMATTAALMEYQSVCPDRPWDLPVYFDMVDEPAPVTVQLIGASIGDGIAVSLTADELDRLDDVSLFMHVSLATHDAIAHWTTSA